MPYRSINLGCGKLGAADILTLQYMDPRSEPATFVTSNFHLFYRKKKWKGRWVNRCDPNELDDNAYGGKQ